MVVGCCLPTRYAVAQDGQISSATSIPSVEDPRTDAVRKQLQANYDEMGAGFAVYDIDAATKYFAKDYKIIGKTNRKQTLHKLRELYHRLLNNALSSQMKTTITLCTLKGDTATVQTHMQLAVHVRREDGSEAYIEGDDLSRDFWVKRNGAWQVKQSRDFDFTITLNGQKLIE